MQIITSLIPIFIFLGLSLIGPIILVSKWLGQPKLALLSATVICFLTLSVVIVLSVFILNMSDGTNMRFPITAIYGVGVMTILLGLPVLALVQWRKRRKQNGLSEKIIKETF